MAMQKAHSSIPWVDYPKLDTPLNAQNLLKEDKSIDVIDDRVISLDTTKFDKTEAQGLFKDVELDPKTGIITFTTYSGAKKTIDTLLEKIAINFDFDEETQKIIITLEDGTTKEVDLKSFITEYEFLDSETIAFTVDTAGKVKAIVKEGSIQEKHLRPDYLADIRVEAAKAEAAKAAAQLSETNAKNSENAAAESASKSADAAEEAAGSATAAAGSASTATAQATSASNSAQAAKTSETNAATSATNAASSAATATSQATSASNSASTATSQANVATAKAKEASDYATKAQSYTEGNTGTREGENTDNASYYYEESKKIYDSFVSTGNVTGVKGGAETDYRHGNVNITKDNLGLGKVENLSRAEIDTQGINLVLGSDVEYTNSNYPIHAYTLSEPFELNQDYTATIWGSLGEGKEYFGGYIGSGNAPVVIRFDKIKEGIYRGSGKLTAWRNEEQQKNSSSFIIYPVPMNSKISTITKIKLEKGVVTAPTWTPAPEDVVVRSELPTSLPANGGTAEHILGKDDRDVKPIDVTKHCLSAYFASTSGLNGGSIGTDYIDLIALNTWIDGSGGSVNALAFDKKAMNIKHYQAGISAGTWGTPKTLAYTDSNVASATHAATADTATTATNASKVSNALTFTGGQNVTYDGSSAKSVAIPTSLPANGGNATTATKLATARTIFGKTFDGTGNVEGQGKFYGVYDERTTQLYATAALQLREKGLVGNAQSDIKYAPGIGFHWGGKVGTSLSMGSDGKLHYLLQNGTSAGTIVATLEGNASTATTATNADTVDNYHIQLISETAYQALTVKDAHTIYCRYK